MTPIRSAHAPRLRLALLLVSSLAAVTSGQTYYPLQVGNRWTYSSDYYGSIYNPNDDSHDTISIVVTDDTLRVGDRVYYTLMGESGYPYAFISADSQEIRIRRNSIDGDYPVFDLTANLGDTLRIQPYILSILTDIDTVIFLGQSTIVRTYRLTTGLSGDNVYRFSDKFGLFGTEDYSGDPPPPWPMSITQLLGCNLSGVTYGFTVGVASIPTIPEQVSLLPNYPNPFNPTTTIPFSLSQRSHATVEVFNTLGQHVRTLMRSELPAGEHSVNFDGRDDHRRQLASGTYFVLLQTETNYQIRTMVLIR